MNAQHTPAPWSEPCTYGLTKFEVQGDGKKVAVFERLEDARHAVKCVNLHDEMLSLVIRGEAWLSEVESAEIAAAKRPEHSQYVLDLRAAIAKAGSAP